MSDIDQAVSTLDNSEVEPTVEEDDEENVKEEDDDSPFAGSDDEDSDNANSDDHDSEIDSMVVAAEEAMQEEVLKHEALTAEEIPVLIDNITSPDATVATTSLERLSSAIIFQGEFISENLAAFDLPRLVKAVDAAPEESVRYGIIQIIVSFADISGSTRQALVLLIPDLMLLLTKEDSTINYYITSLLEQLLDSEPISHDLIQDGVKALYEPFKGMDDTTMQSADECRLASLIQTFDSVITYARAQCRKVFLRASAFNVVVNAASKIKSAKVRKSALSCLVQMNLIAGEIDEDLPEHSSLGSTQPIIITSIVGLMDDQDEEISSEATQFFSQDREEELNNLIMEVVRKTPTIVPSLVRKLGTKEPGHVGVPAEFALLKLNENEGGKELLYGGFKKVWEDQNIKTDEKLKIVGGLADSFVDLRKAAYQSGLLDHMSKLFEDDQTVILSMTTFARLMDNDQQAGYHLLQTPDMLEKIVDIFDNGSSEVQSLAATILRHTVGCYDEEGESQRSVATARLFGPTILPRLLKALDTGDPAVANASAKVVSEILSDEEGTASWAYDEQSNNPPPPTPMKDAINTEDRALCVVNLLKHEESAEGALELLCQFCWGNKRGYEIVQRAFEKVIPDADVFFFANIYGKYSGRMAGRMRRHVADAAVAAGALARVEALLEIDHPTAEARSASVEAYRVILAADCLDAAIGRKNKRLPVVMKRVLEDRNLDSFKNVCWMIRLLVDDEEKEKECFAVWKESEFASLETAKAFLYWLTRPSKAESLEKPDSETMTEQEFAKKDREYDAQIKAIKSEESELTSLLGEAMTNLVPILAPYAPHFMSPLLNATNTWDQNSQLMTLLEEFASNEEVFKTALVPAIQDLLSKPSSDSLDSSTIESWISKGPSLATAFYLGGILEYLKQAEMPNEDGNLLVNSTVLLIYESLARHVPDTEYRRAIRAAFFASQPVTDKALENLCNAEGLWEAEQAARTLEVMTRDYPEGMAILSSKNGVYQALVKLLQDHNTSCDPVAKLAGRLGPGNLDALKEVVHTLITQLVSPAETEPTTTIKKGKKKKKYQPKISLPDVLDRLQAIVQTTPEARQAVFETGAFDVIRKGLNGTKDGQKYALKLLKAFAEENNVAYRDQLGSILPQTLPLFNANFDELEILVQFCHDLVTSDFVQPLIDADLHEALFKTFTDFPTSVGNMQLIIETVRDLCISEKARAAMVIVIKASLEKEDALEQEEFWGNAHAIRRLIDENELSARAVLEGGAIDYVLRLLQGGNSNPHLFGIGAALVGTLVHSAYLPDARAAIVERGIPALLNQAWSKCEEQVENCSKDDDEAKRGNLNKWIGILSTSLKIINGEEVDNYVEDFFI